MNGKSSETFEDSIARVRAMLVDRGIKGAETADIKALANMVAAAAFQDARPANAAHGPRQKPAEGNHGWRRVLASIESRRAR